MLDFRTEECQLTTRIDGVDRDFLFGNTQLTKKGRHQGGQTVKW